MMLMLVVLLDAYDNYDLVRQVPYVVDDVEDVQRRFGNWTIEKRENTPETISIKSYPRWADIKAIWRRFMITMKILRPFLVSFFASCPNVPDKVNTSKDVITCIGQRVSKRKMQKIHKSNLSLNLCYHRDSWRWTDPRCGWEKGGKERNASALPPPLPSLGELCWSGTVSLPSQKKRGSNKISPSVPMMLFKVVFTLEDHTFGLISWWMMNDEQMSWCWYWYWADEQINI